MPSFAGLIAIAFAARRKLLIQSTTCLPVTLNVAIDVFLLIRMPRCCRRTSLITSGEVWTASCWLMWHWISGVSWRNALLDEAFRRRHRARVSTLLDEYRPLKPGLIFLRSSRLRVERDTSLVFIRHFVPTKTTPSYASTPGDAPDFIASF